MSRGELQPRRLKNKRQDQAILGGTTIGEDVNLKEEKNTGVPIWEKVTLTVDEAAEYSNVGKNKIRELTDVPFCPFVMRVGRKRLIKRREFEKYLLTQISI